MEKRIINPWTWQDQYGYVQANEVSGHSRVLWCAGQTSVDEDGNPLHEGDMVLQAHQCIDNLETVLREADFTLADVMRLNLYVTDVDAYFGAAEAVGQRLGEAGCRFAGTLLEVNRLAMPELMIEIEATAAK
ncbi:MAG TPA: Rid family hydrolase [Thermoleophilaceae bacterium]|nr:Rid family hydrolase [Thermoleophilaceae bacterium]